MRRKPRPFARPRSPKLGLLAAASVAAFLAAAVPAQAGFVYVTSRSNEISQYSIGPAGRLAPLSPPTVSAPDGAVAVGPGGHSVYVTDASTDRVSQYSARADGTLRPKSPASVVTGSHPEDIAISPNDKDAYVTSGTSISQYSIGPDGALSPKSPAAVSSGDGPVDLVVSPDGQSVYVSTGDLTVLQYSVGADGALSPKSPAGVATIFENSKGIAITPNGESVYVATLGNFRGDSHITQYSVNAGGTLAPKSPPLVGTNGIPEKLAVSPNGESVYVTGGDFLTDVNSVTQYSVGPGGLLFTKSPAVVDASGSPFGIALSPDGHSVYVANALGVLQYTVGSGGVLSPKSPPQIAAGTVPQELAVSPLPNPNPETTITKGPSGVTNDPTPSFAFKSSKPGSTFQCKLDSGSYSACTSPKTTAHLGDGVHTFYVRAKSAGHLDPTPASRGFRVKTASVGLSSRTLVITAAPGAKDNLAITRPSPAIVRITDFPSGPYTGSGVHTGTGCTRSGDDTANCSGEIALVRVSSGDQNDQVVNSTGVTSSLYGEKGNDALTGGSRTDTITGGAGADVMKGMNGNDQLFARDLTSDTLINCDGGIGTPGSADKADLDKLPKDPASVVQGCETKTRH
jgi:DNA-binding beta-propeller fold protein YncE